MDKDFLKKIEEAAPSKELMDKLYEAILDGIPEEMYVIKEVNFNSDVINSEFCIFFPMERNMFTLLRYPADGKMLPVTIRDAIKFLDRECYSRPMFVLIPFNVYATYASQHPSYPEDLPTPSLDYVCKEFGMTYKVMIPDRLKDKVNGVI